MDMKACCKKKALKKYDISKRYGRLDLRMPLCKIKRVSICLT